jgi:hydroxymethylpyrimidine pyrophosphatase-like HAD family hydrolase
LSIAHATQTASARAREQDINLLILTTNRYSFSSRIAVTLYFTPTITQDGKKHLEKAPYGRVLRRIIGVIDFIKDIVDRPTNSFLD